MLAEEITAPVREITLGTRTVNARFDHNMMHMAEIYWQTVTLRKLSYLGIIDQAVSRTYCGLGAVCYGAVASAAMAANRTPVSVHDFDRMFDYFAIKGAAQSLIDGVLAGLPKDSGIGDAKNAEGRT